MKELGSQVFPPKERRITGVKELGSQLGTNKRVKGGGVTSVHTEEVSDLRLAA